MALRQVAVNFIDYSGCLLYTTICAGLAVLGNWVYSAEEGSVYSDEALEVCTN